MLDNKVIVIYDTQIELIIDYLKEKIKAAEYSKEHWQENYRRHNMADYYLTAAVNHIAAFKEVLEFIEETYKTDDNGK